MNSLDNTHSALAVIPFVFDKDETFWQQDRMHEAFALMFNGLQALPEVQKVMAISGSREISIQLEKAGFPSVSCASCTQPSQLCSPRGVEEALSILGPAYFSEKPILLCDPRFAFAGFDGAGSVLRSWQQEKDHIWASVEVAEDHPCQCRQYISVYGIGYIALFADSQSSEGEADCFTRPTRLPLELVSGGGLSHVELATLCDSKTTENSSCYSSYSLKIDRSLISRAQCGDLGDELAGVSIFCDGAEGSILLYRNPDGFYYAVSNMKTGHAIQLSVGSKNNIMEIVFDDGRSPLFKLPSGVNGFNFSLVETVVHDNYDISLPFPHNGTLWQNSGSEMINSHSGKLIYGRQEFPECHILNGRFIAGTWNQLISFSDNFSAGAVKGVPVEPAQKISTMREYVFMQCVGGNDVR